MNRKGFTLIELVLVIAILGILAVAALPRFINITDNANAAARDGVVGAVRSGIALVRAQNLVAGGNGTPPTTLDSNAAGACVTCFDGVLSSGVNSTAWNRSGTGWTHIPTNTTYTYDNVNGTF